MVKKRKGATGKVGLRSCTMNFRTFAILGRRFSCLFLLATAHTTSGHVLYKVTTSTGRLSIINTTARSLLRVVLPRLQRSLIN